MFKYLLVLLIPAQVFATDFLPKSFSAKFEQVKTSIISGKKTKSLGNIDYQYPSGLKLEMNAPEKLYLVSNATKTWYYRPPFIEGEKGELTEKNTGATELSTFFDILKFGLKKNKFYSASAHKGRINLRFSDYGKKRINIKGAEIFYNGAVAFKNVYKIIIEPVETNKFSLTLTEVKTDVKFSKDHFVFKAP